MKSSKVNLINNGYEGIVIAINPSVPEDEKLIQNIKADVIVANPYLKYGDDPYTLQYGRCGEKGQYIHFTPNFLLTNNLPIYGSRGRVFVHEWAHLRWGIFDENNGDQPFYISRRNTIEATRSKQRVVCLVLDKSGSMSSEDRLFRMNQAAELFLIQIIEKGSFVGMVTFDSVAKIRNHLTKITDDNVYKNITANLPQEADGGTSICRGLKAGFQAIIQSNQSTSGSEIILLTDGEDNEIHLCIEEVKQSGVIIHTIALGPSAAKELETLSDITGGHRFYANKDINGLTNAFSRISSRSGSITQQTVQLESKALAITGKKWVNGTVPVDSTIGNDTFFVVTWTIKKPEVLLQDPKGKKYKTSDFKEDKLNIRSARLRIPGIAELFLTALGLHCCIRLSLVVMSRGCSLAMVCWLFIAVASLVAEDRL
ncbi:hypothetical protein MJG53_001841 [Ovis ammon polii x Ovis aries]|uniref:Uncharacterized protein n=1 Tax=Ovis ammon polii x Ovis aries TaxID=2918886 RepID=A0ACB9VLH9_9CETA|nr:hypothetical protein MJG53_001841 [Ovis ammon polii x Ovis aries]